MVSKVSIVRRWEIADIYDVAGMRGHTPECAAFGERLTQAVPLHYPPSARMARIRAPFLPCLVGSLGSFGFVFGVGAF